MKTLSILAFAIFLCTGIGYADDGGYPNNLLTNFSWETGDTTGWNTCGGGMTPALHMGPHHGDHDYGTSGCCGAWGDPVGAIQTVTTNPALDYDVWGWVKGCDGGQSSFGVGNTNCGQPATTTLVTNTNCVWSSGSTQLSGVSSITVNYYAPPHGDWGSATVRFDDTYVNPVESVDEWALY